MFSEGVLMGVLFSHKMYQISPEHFGYKDTQETLDYGSGVRLNANTIKNSTAKEAQI